MEKMETIRYGHTSDLIQRIAMKIWRRRSRRKGFDEDLINNTLDKWTRGETALCVSHKEILAELERIDGPQHAPKRKFW